jgi:regulatory protein
VVRIHLSDGSFFILHAEVFAREAISAGTPLDAEKVAGLLSSSERVFARLRALSLLSRAAHSRKGLERKLASRGFSAEAIRDALARVSELGYLDDRAFAESWVRSRMSMRKTGWNALYKGLLTRGVARAIAEEVVGALCSWEEEIESARQLADGLSPRAAIRRLASRGFRSRTISKVLKEKKETDRGAAEG